MRVKPWALTRAFSTKVSSSQSPPARIVLKNVSWYTGEKDLKNYFSRFGKVQYVKLVYDWETGFHKGFAFAAFRCIDDALKVVQQHNHHIDGRQVVAKIAVPNYKKEQH